MIAAVPIVPGYDLPVTEIAKSQQDIYKVLPAHITPDGRVIVRWHLSWRERFKLLWTGDLWHHILTFNKSLQPILLSVDPPEVTP